MAEYARYTGMVTHMMSGCLGLAAVYCLFKDDRQESATWLYVSAATIAGHQLCGGRRCRALAGGKQNGRDGPPHTTRGHLHQWHQKADTGTELQVADLVMGPPRGKRQAEGRGYFCQASTQLW